MLKTLTILTVVCVAVVSMPAQNQVVSSRASGQRQQNAEKTPKPSVAPVTNNQSTAYYQQESNERPQGWYKFIAWPEGITALAVVLTLGAIVWQAVETRRSVRTARDAIILQYRPKIVVRSLRLIRSETGSFEIRLVLRNSGNTTAHISETAYEINWIKEGSITDTHTEIAPAINLKAGDSHTLCFIAPEFFVRFGSSRIILEENPEQQQTVFLACNATIAYTDDIKTRRETGLARLYSFRQQSFVLGDDAVESDYSD